MKPARVLCLAVLALGGCTGSRDDSAGIGGAGTAEVLAGRTAGRAARCIDADLAGGPQIVGETLLYHDGGRLWVSRPIGGCASLRGDPITIVEMHGGQICRGDRFRTIERGGIGVPGPYCRFGDFVPYTKPR